METYSFSKDDGLLGKKLIAVDAFEKFGNAAAAVIKEGGDVSPVKDAHAEFCHRLSLANSLQKIRIVEDIIKSDESIDSFIEIVQEDKANKSDEKIDLKLSVIENQNEKQISIITEAKEKAEKDAEDAKKDAKLSKVIAYTTMCHWRSCLYRNFFIFL